MPSAIRIGRGTGSPHEVQRGLACAAAAASSGISKVQHGQRTIASRSRAIAERHSVSITRASGFHSPSVKERVNRSRSPDGIAFQRATTQSRSPGTGPFASLLGSKTKSGAAP